MVRHPDGPPRLCGGTHLVALLPGRRGLGSYNSTDVTFGGVQIGQTSKTRSGWTIGGGVEWMFAPHWSAFLEGNYMDFGSNDRTVFTPVACPAGCAFSTKATAATVLVGVNYRFW